MIRLKSAARARVRAKAVYCLLLCGAAFSALLLSGTALAETPPLVNVTFSPSNPVPGDTVSAFIELVSPFNSSQTVTNVLTAQDVSATGSTAVPLLHPEANLWIAQLGPYQKASSHMISVTLCLQDTQEASALQDQIVQLDVEISANQDKLAGTEDINLKQQLEAEISQEKTQRQQLMQALGATSTMVGTDTFSFSVGPAH